MTGRYVGGELELFAAATNWKRYFAETLRPYVSGRVLEVGAGIGANIPYLHNQRVSAWACLEPDPDLAAQIAASATTPAPCRVITATVASLDPDARFDCILYIDVLEHVADDRAELDRAARHLAPGGNLVVLSPAHQFLFSEFDRSIGHHRRYNAASLSALTPAGCRLRTCLMLDSVGLLASLANAAVLRQSMPSARQIRTWDGLMVPMSRVIDRATAHRLGKTIVAVWTS